MKHVVEALIEIPYGSRNKYEVDKATGRIRLDRVLYSAMSYPGEYGYIVSPDQVLDLEERVSHPDTECLGFVAPGNGTAVIA